MDPTTMLIGGGAVLGGLSSAFGIDSGNKAALKAYKAQAKALITNYNYGMVSLRTQGRSAFEEAARELQKNTISSMKNQSMVEVALAETGVEGRSQDRVMRDVRGYDAMTRASIKENFERQTYNLKQDAESMYQSTKSQINAARSQTQTQMTGGFASVLKIAQGAISGAMLGSEVSNMYSSITKGTTKTLNQEALTDGLGYSMKPTSYQGTDYVRGIGYGRW